MPYHIVKIKPSVAEYGFHDQMSSLSFRTRYRFKQIYKGNRNGHALMVTPTVLSPQYVNGKWYHDGEFGATGNGIGLSYQYMANSGNGWLFSWKDAQGRLLYHSAWQRR